jgi:hypothetical protein
VGDSRKAADYCVAAAGVQTVRRLSQALGVDGFGAVWRRLVLAFTLVAFAQAGYFTQTHIHGAPALPGNSVVAQAGHSKPTVPDDPAHCPLCQEYLLAGAFLIPPPIILPTPSAAAFAASSIARVLPYVAVASHSWRGRAPPLA